MTFTINKKIYETDESLTVYDFINKSNLFLPVLDNENEKLLYELCYIEQEGNNSLVNARTTYISDGDIFYTNSKKVYDYLNEIININNSELKNNLYKEVSISRDHYNILLCEAECYDECLTLYKDFGFNDIISDKFAQMILFIEMTHQLLLKTSKKMDQKSKTPLVVLQQNIIKYPKKYRLNLKSADEIAAELIKNYYKETLKIDKPINIIYVTNSLSCLVSHLFKNKEYEPLIDDVVMMNNFEITNLKSDVIDFKVSKAIYIKEERLNQSCNYNSIFKILHQMGFIEESLDIYTTEYGKTLVVKYKGLELKFLFTDKYLTIDELVNSKYDFILVTTKKGTSTPNSDEGILTDYNVNQIYKKFIIHPGNKNMFKRF